MTFENERMEVCEEIGYGVIELSNSGRKIETYLLKNIVTYITNEENRFDMILRYLILFLH